MLKRMFKNRSVQFVSLGIAAAGFALAAGCQENSSAKPTTMAATKGGAQLWSDNCMRCHNLRPPTQFSNSEWQIIVHHMRIRGNLTGQEERDILAFIQSANVH